MIPNELIRDVDLLCLDAGNTIVFFDAIAATDATRDAGMEISPDALLRADAAVKRRLDAGTGGLCAPLPEADIQPTWSSFMLTAVQLATGFDVETTSRAVRVMWAAHNAFNLWRRVPDGLIAAITELRAAGVPVCVVSNSEGRLRILFERLGIANDFDYLIDSQLVGFEKPDPRIFHHALERFGVNADRALHLGDVVAADIVGGRAAGVRVALIDGAGIYEGLHTDVVRVPDVATVARSIIADRERRAR